MTSDFTMHLLTLLGFAGCGLLALFFLAIYRHVTSPLRSIPGPFLARFTDLWYLFKLRSGHFEVIHQQLHDTYGTFLLLQIVGIH